MPSVAQVVPTIPVFDYLYDPTSGKALANQEVIIQLEFNKATAIAPVVSLPNLPLKVTTDPNGYWTANLVPNTNINPANTVYSVRAGGQSFQISVQAGPGPYQASAIATTTPPAMVPAGPFTAGSVLFAGTGGAAVQNNAQLFWDNVNNRLGIGTNAPAGSLHARQPSGGTGLILDQFAAGDSSILLRVAGVNQWIAYVSGGNDLRFLNAVLGLDRLALTQAGHLTFFGPTPTATTNINANVTGISVTGTDSAFKVTFNVVTGTIAAGSRLFTVTLASPFLNVPVAVCTASNIIWHPQTVSTGTTTIDIDTVDALPVAASYQVSVICVSF